MREAFGTSLMNAGPDVEELHARNSPADVALDLCSTGAPCPPSSSATQRSSSPRRVYRKTDGPYRGLTLPTLGWTAWTISRRNKKTIPRRGGRSRACRRGLSRREALRRMGMMGVIADRGVGPARHVATDKKTETNVRAPRAESRRDHRTPRRSVGPTTIRPATTTCETVNHYPSPRLPSSAPTQRKPAPGRRSW